MTGSDVARSLGWSVQRVAREGNAERLHVEKDGTTAILYVFTEPDRGRRVAWAHSADHAAQLFVVPELIESKDNWVLVQDIDGLPLSEFLVESGSATITPQLADELEYEAFRRGLLVLGCGSKSVRISPPLVIDEATMASGLLVLEQALENVSGVLSPATATHGTPAVVGHREHSA